MFRSSRTARSDGFTLVEMLIIAPMALLIIAAFIAVLVTMVGDVMVSHGRNALTHDIQSSLDTIEQDVRLSTEFVDTTSAMPTPQGKNGSTSAFTSGSGDLILGQIATDKNPIDPTRGFIYYQNAPFGCSDPLQTYKNRIFFTTVIYFVQNNSLWRRTFVPAPSGGTLCTTQWQVNTCAPGYASSATQCQANDSEVMKNVSSFTVEYFTDGASTVALAPADAGNASTIRVQINGSQGVAGRTLTATASLRATKLSDKDIRLAPPGIPAVTAQPYNTAEPNTGTFTWTANPLVSYSVRYNINGGAWITAAENTNQTSIKLTASRADTITVQVAARNSTGSSGYGAGASITMPSWESCSLENGWINYGAPYHTCGYTMTEDGVVVLKGHIKNGTTGSIVLFQLPARYRPSQQLVFQTVTAYHSTARIDVTSSGYVQLRDSGNSIYLGLDGIRFIPSQSLHTWTNMSLLNGWTNYGGSYTPLQTATDSSGRVHIRGLIREGTFTSGTPIAQLPGGSAPSHYLNVSARADGVANDIGINSSGQILARGVSSSYLSTPVMYHPSSYAGWQNFTTVAGAPTDNQIGQGWQAYGGTSAPPRFTKSADGIVTVQGLIRNGNTTDLTFFAKLPAGYRPAVTLAFITASSTGHARIDVGDGGWLVVRVMSATWTSLEGITFVAEQ